MSAAVIRFPPPPPTHNQLSNEQRAKLIRTNNKLGQVLGSTPHVLDLSYIVPAAPRTREDMPAPPPTPTKSKNPFRTHIRRKSVPKIDIGAIRVITKSPDSVSSSGSSESSGSRRSTTSARVKTDELAWRSPYPGQRPPLLKLSVPPLSSRKPRLETIPGSPPFDQPMAPIAPPTFHIPSEAAMRREKMRRVRKMLGDGVPTDLIFPSSPDDSESESEEDSPMVTTPTSVMSREWLLVDVNKPLPEEPATPFPQPQLSPATARSGKGTTTKPAPSVLRKNRLFTEQRKRKPSKDAKQLESIAESAKEREGRPESVTCVGVSASAGVSGLGKSRRFVQGEVEFDQIGSVWGGMHFV